MRVCNYGNDCACRRFVCAQSSFTMLVMTSALLNVAAILM